MPELIPENRLPLNRLAKRKLRQARQEPSQSGLYVFQLMSWGLESRQDGLHPKFRDEVRKFLNRLSHASPNEAWRFLNEGEDPDDVWNLDYEALSLEGPKQVAQVLLDLLHTQMGAKIQGYPPV